MYRAYNLKSICSSIQITPNVSKNVSIYFCAVVPLCFYGLLMELFSIHLSRPTLILLLGIFCVAIVLRKIGLLFCFVDVVEESNPKSLQLVNSKPKEILVYLLTAFALPPHCMDLS